MGEKNDDWASERISMTHLGNLSRSSNYVRSLVRQQFHQQSDQPATAWARLRERLAKTGQESFESIDSEEGFQSFMKKKQSEKTSRSDSDGNSGDEDEEEEEETFVYLKTASPEKRFSTSVDNKKNKAPEKSPPGSRCVPSPSTRRLSAPQTPSTGIETEKKYTFGSTDAHSQILNRRLSLAENVIKNYSKYIRTPDEDQPQERTPRINIEDEGAGTEREQTSKKLSIVAITEEESSTLTDVKLVDRDESPVMSSSVSHLVIPQGSSYTVPPSPSDESEKSFFNGPATLRRNSFSGMFSEELSFHQSGTDTTSKATKEKLSANKLPRISQTSQGRREVSANSREEAINELKENHKELTKNNLLKQSTRKKETFYQQLKRDQERRALRSEIFNREMEDIRKALKGINSRLDERIKILDCYDPPKMNVKLHRILQVALAGIPFSK